MDIKILSLLSQVKSETKLQIISILYFQGGISINEIVKLTNKNRKNVSKQINELVDEKILIKEIVGRYHMIHFNKKINNQTKEILELIIQKFIKDKRKEFKGVNHE